MRTRTLASVVVAAAVVFAASARAEARHVKFLGPHPVASKFGGGYCYIESPHIHVYTPDRQPLYQQVGDQWVFTGDPTPFGYEGDRHTFYGHHPVVTVGGEPVYCYLNGPHYHSFAAPDLPDYKIDHGVAFYVGPYPPQYAKMRPQRAKMINAEYRPYVGFRPTIQVAPPPEWQGEVYVAPPSVQVSAPGVMVQGPPPPRVYVGAPPPRVQVEVSAPGVYVAPPRPPSVVVGAPGPHVYVGAPPPPHVYVGAPPPHVVVGGPRVVVGAPPPTVVVGAPPPGVVVQGKVKYHHDNGKHKGWYKH